MRIYLMRHGIALDRAEWEGPDEARPLTEKGRRRSEEVLRALREFKDLNPAVILSSPARRAWETAGMAAQVLKAPRKVCPSLAPGQRLPGLIRALRVLDPQTPILLAGHEPQLSSLLSYLTALKKTKPLKKAGVACCEGTLGPGKMRLIWLLRPKDILAGKSI